MEWIQSSQQGNKMRNAFNVSHAYPLEKSKLKLFYGFSIPY